MNGLTFAAAQGARDHALCAAIWLAASLEAHAFIPASFWREHAPVMRDYYLPSAEVIMAYDAGLPAGFCALRGDELAALFVHPEHWRKGIGKGLMERAKAAHNRLELGVYEKNRNALAFYRAGGFELLERGVCDHSGETELRLVWERDPCAQAGECEKFRPVPS